MNPARNASALVLSLILSSQRYVSPAASAFNFKRHNSSKLPLAPIISIMPSGTKTTPIDLPVKDVGTHSKYEKHAAGFWNRLANHYYNQPIKDGEAYEKKLEITRGYLTPQSKILEFGCGTGGTAIKHASYVHTVHAIDFSSKMIDIAKDQAAKADPAVPNVKFQCVGIDSYQVPEASYDVVMGMSILHLLPNKDQVLGRVHTMVKPGGYFVSSTTCMGDFAGTFLKYVAPPLSRMGLLPKLIVFTKDELKASIEKAGFTIEEEYQSGDGKDKEAAVFLVAKKIG
ncbi:MAG: hypothetical protein SGILL_000853 [Bacillariaceae sp.]